MQSTAVDVCVSSPSPITPSSLVNSTLSDLTSRPFFLYCLNCSFPLSDSFHVVESDVDVLVVEKLYADTIIMKDEAIANSEEGMYFELACKKCHAAIGRYYRLTAPHLQHYTNRFTLEIRYVGIRQLGSGIIEGAAYLTATGISTRILQTMITVLTHDEQIKELQQQIQEMKQRIDHIEESENPENEQQNKAKKRPRTIPININPNSNPNPTSSSSSSSLQTNPTLSAGLSNNGGRPPIASAADHRGRISR